MQRALRRLHVFGKNKVIDDELKTGVIRRLCLQPHQPANALIPPSIQKPNHLPILLPPLTRLPNQSNLDPLGIILPITIKRVPLIVRLPDPCLHIHNTRKHRNPFLVAGNGYRSLGRPMDR